MLGAKVGKLDAHVVPCRKLYWGEVWPYESYQLGGIAGVTKIDFICSAKDFSACLSIVADGQGRGF